MTDDRGGGVRAVAGTLGKVAFAGNLLGGVLAFVYFRFVDVQHASMQSTTLGASIFFVVSFAVVAALGVVVGRHFTQPLVSWAKRGEGADVAVRQLALWMPFRMARLTAGGWLLSAIAWSLVWPAVTGDAAASHPLRSFVGIAVVGGTVATVFTFFAVERQWRVVLPLVFPDGDVSATPGVARIPVRARLLAIFFLVGVMPVVLLGILTYTRAAAMIGAGPEAASARLHDMALFIGFVVVVGGAASIGLAAFVSRSVAEPLREVERAMARVAGGDLSSGCAMVSNDEIGAVAEGFNRMVAGLRDRERIRETFGKYVSPEVRDEILAGRVTLGGQVRAVTILFSDLRDFTPWVESHPADEVVRDLNAYFTLMEGAIRDHGGLVVQFIGDEIEAVFGAPVAEARHADRAVAAGIEMRRRLDAWNAPRLAAGLPVLCHGIGIHTGEVLAAAIGSLDRLSYALVGDPVNVASRIQGLTRDVGGDVLVSGDTVRRLKDGFPLERLPAVRVKGRSAEVEVYRVA